MNLLEMLQQIGISAKRVATTQGGEYHSACPSCGGTNRFFIHPEKQMSKCLGSYCCRQCKIHGDSIEFARQFLKLSFHDAVETVTGIKTIEHRPIQLSYKTQQQKLPQALYYPSAEWIINATKFVQMTRENLLNKPDIIKYLTNRGIPVEAINRYNIGWNSEDRYFLKTDWDLSEENKKLWIPAGLVIPVMDVNRVIRLKIRRSHWAIGDELPKYIAISGSMNGLNIIGSQKHTIVIIVESELDAVAIDHAVGDFVCAIAVGSCMKNPDNITNYLAKKAVKLLICYDNDIAGEKMLIKWQSLYPHAIACPVPQGKDIGQAIEMGLNLQEWLKTKIY